MHSEEQTIMKRHSISPSRHSRLSALALATAIAATTVDATAQEDTLGKTLYEEACATCHGLSGRGDGEFSQYLTLRPADLTVIAKSQSDGEFPFLDVFMVIDGRTGVRGHGSPDMPIWGHVFSREVGESGGPYGAELLIRANLVALTDYVHGLQTE